MYVCMYVCMYVYVYVRVVCVCTYVYLYIGICIYRERGKEREREIEGIPYRCCSALFRVSGFTCRHLHVWMAFCGVFRYDKMALVQTKHP